VNGEAIHVETPFTDDDAGAFMIGERVLVSGTLWVARDAAHMRMVEALENGKNLPFPSVGAVMFYMGPSPARPGEVIGAAGPTTAARMDRFVRPLLECGVKGMIGKGERSDGIRKLCADFCAVYLAATGGAGALLGERIKSVEVVAYEDLGPEALRKIEVEDFPAVVAIDASGRDLYAKSREKWGPSG
jgi:fumarate hydratase subunit beta